ncbi:hypothetical protein [Candidatus Phytoplasma rubi]
MEPITRQFFMQKTNLTFEDTFSLMIKLIFFSASLDSYNEQNQVVL